MHLLLLIDILMFFSQVVHLFLEIVDLFTDLLLLGFFELFYFLSEFFLEVVAACVFGGGFLALGDGLGLGG